MKHNYSKILINLKIQVIGEVSLSLQLKYLDHLNCIYPEISR